MSTTLNSGTPSVAEMKLPEWHAHLEGYRRYLGTTEERPYTPRFFRRDLCGNCGIPVDDCRCD